MRLLFLTPQIPYPPHKGTTIRNFNLIAGLAQNHEIDLLSFADTHLPRVESSSPLLDLCRRVETIPAPTRSNARRALSTLFSPQPDMALRLWSSEFASRLATRLHESDYDIIQVEGIEMGRYGMLARRHAAHIPWVFDDHNAEWLLQQRTYQAERQLNGWSIGALYSLIQTWKLKRFEQRLCRASQHVLVVSKADASAISELDPVLPITIVTNGVDTEHYRSDIVDHMDFGAPSLVFTGTMDFRPNVDAVLWFADRVWPKIRAVRPDVQFMVVGQRPHARLEPLRSQPGIQIVGAVDDTRPYIAGAAVYVVPLRIGGGTRLKVLEAMALQQAIVSTSMGVDGLEVGDGRELLVEDDEDRFAQSVLNLIDDRARCKALGAQARRHVEALYDWKAIVPRVEEVYQELHDKR